MAGVKKTLVTAAGPHMSNVLRHFSLPLFERFAERHGYSVCVNNFDEDSLERKDTKAIAARWQKIELIRNCLRKSDVVVWFDADVMIVRCDEDIVNHVTEQDYQGFVLHNVPAENRVNPNTGVWVMRHTQEAFDFLDSVESVGIISKRWADQAAVMKVLGWEMGDDRHIGARKPEVLNTFAVATSWLPIGWNQPYVEDRPNPEVYAGRPTVENPNAVHFMAMTISDRLVHMENLSKKINYKVIEYAR